MPKENDYLIFDCDMATGAQLRIIKQGDGDIVLHISDPNDGNPQSAGIEFCTPMMGGGRHERLWKVLATFFTAEMKILDDGNDEMPPISRAD